MTAEDTIWANFFIWNAPESMRRIDRRAVVERQ